MGTITTNDGTSIFYKDWGSGVPGLDLPGLDYVSLAKGYGCAGRKIVSPEDLAPAVREALAMDTPYLLEVEIDSSYPTLL